MKKPKSIKLLSYVKGKVNTLLFVLLGTMLSMSTSAQTINLSFPSGFDNCMAPTPNAGTYTLAGTMNGKNYYTKGGNLRIIWSGTRWEIQGDDPNISGVSWYAGYVNTNNTTLPPSDCWTSPAGCFLPLLAGSVTPTVSTTTITRAGYNVAVSGTASYTVTFSATVNGLTASNFTTVNSGTVSGSSVASTTQVNSTTWTVVVNTGTGDGGVGLNMVNGTGTGAAFCSAFPVTGPVYTVNSTVAPVTLGAGDIAFTGYNSSSATVDNFSFVVLKTGGLLSGTKIYFSDNGYGTVESAMRPGEGAVMWTASSAVAQFTQVTITCNISPVSHTASTGTVAAILNNINLSSSGDQVLAYQGNMSSPAFISAIQMNAETGTAGVNGNSTLTNWDDFSTGSSPFLISTARSAIPPGLTNGTDAIMAVNNAGAPFTELDNAVYNCTGATSAASLPALRAAINNRDNWSKQDNTPYTIPPSCTFSVVSPSVINTTGTLTAFSTCGGTASVSQSFTVSGTSLTAALVITAPAGFEVSTTVGSGYAASVSLTPSGGTVNNTTIYVRLKSTATGTPSGNVACSSTGAATKNVAVSGTVTTPSNWYLDADNDGHYVSGPVSACSSPGPGYNTTATQNGDCDDNNNAVYQDLPGYVDTDGDGYTVGSLVSVCSGAALPAGYTAVSLGTDCNDNNNAVHPAAAEILCNGIDENCNGMGDDGVQSTAAASAASDALFNEICIGGSATLSFSGGSLGTGASWKWYSGSCAGSLAGTGTSILVSPTVSTTYFVKAEGGCNTTNCVQVSIAVKTAPPSASVVVPPINNLPAYGCNGVVVNNINVPLVASASRYIWDGPAGTTFNGGNNPYITETPGADITFGNPSGSGYYIGIQAANACGASLRKTQWARGVVSTPASVDPAIAGLNTYCANTSAAFSCPMVSGASGYLWTITGDATLIPSGNSVTVNFGPAWTSGTLCVSSLTTCFTSPPKCILLSTAQAPAYSSSGVFIVCAGSTHTYSVPTDLDVATYTWTLPPNSTGSSVSNSINVTYTLGFAAGDICVQATSICGVNLPQKCKSVTSGAATTPASITGTTNGLCGTTTTYTCTPQAGATFNWTLPPGATGSSATNAISVTFPGSGFTTSTLSVEAVNACGTSGLRTITVKGSPNTPGIITANPPAWCNNDAGIQFTSNVSGIDGVYSLNWNVIPAAAAVIQNGQGTSSIITDWNTGGASIQLTASNSCGSATRTYAAGTSCRVAGENNVSYEAETASINFYPNPAFDFITVDINASDDERIIYTITDIAGKQLLSSDLKVEAGFNKKQIDLSNISKGIYWISFKSSGFNLVKKITLQ